MAINIIKNASEFLDELRKLIPEIPELVKSLSIHVSAEHVTFMKCEFLSEETVHTN